MDGEREVCVREDDVGSTCLKVWEVAGWAGLPLGLGAEWQHAARWVTAALAGRLPLCQ